MLSERGVELRVVTADSVQAFAKLDAGRFSYLNVQSKANNEIHLEINLATLISALKSAERAEEATLRLARKKNVPVLAVSAETLNGIQVTQDVAIVRIMTAEEAERFREPRLRDPDVTLRLPDAKHLKTVLERMRSLDKFAQLKAYARGALVLKIDTDVVSTRTVFQGLALDEEEEEGGAAAEEAAEGADAGRRPKRARHGAGRGNRDMVAVTLGLKELLLMTSGVAACKPRRAVLAVVEGAAVVVHLALGGSSSLTYLAPSLVDEHEAADADALRDPHGFGDGAGLDPHEADEVERVAATQPPFAAAASDDDDDDDER